MHVRADGGELVQRFESLLCGFGSAQSACRDRSTPRDSLRVLLEGFLAVSCHEKDLQNKHTERYAVVLKEFDSAVRLWRISQQQSADEFNLLDVMGVVGRETMHSGVLAWLLACSPAGRGIAGTHGQGSLGLKLLLTELAELRLPQWYADSPYWVRTEVRGTESIIDIEVACRGKFLVHIENKIWSAEGTKQTSREWDDLGRRADVLSIPCHHRHALFLTPRGAPARDSRFAAISWLRIVRIFEAFAEQANPLDVKLFCRHYADALRRSIVEADELEEVDDGEAIVQ